LVQEFIWVEFWIVVGQTDQPESPGMPGNEPCHDGEAMHGMPIDEEIDPAAD
jgi:hypothetical protein